MIERPSRFRCAVCNRDCSRRPCRIARARRMALVDRITVTSPERFARVRAAFGDEHACYIDVDHQAALVVDLVERRLA